MKRLVMTSLFAATLTFSGCRDTEKQIRIDHGKYNIVEVEGCEYFT